MPLGPVDFTKAKNDYPVIPVPRGETLDVEVISKSWEDQANTNGEGRHIVAKYSVTWEFDGKPRTFELRVVWPYTSEGGMWRVKRDLIKLGADPAEFEAGDPPGSKVDLESILNELFASPHKAIARIREETFTPRDHVPSDPTSPQPRQQNQVMAIKAPDADW